MFDRRGPRPGWLAARAGGLLFAICAAVSLAIAPAFADDEPDANGVTAPSIATSLPYNGDPTGLRKAMATYGATFNFIYTNDVLGNVNGGLRRGVIDQGKLEYNMTVEFEKLIGWQGLSLYTNGFLIHNTGRIRRDYVGGINTIAAIEAVPTGRLSELWLEQKFWDGKASLRVGQLAADVEFFFDEVGIMFLQTDWPTITAANLPSGGPAYPLSTPGVRLKVEPNENVAVLAAVFNGDPGGPGIPGNEQLRNKYGVNFRVRDLPFAIAEAQFRINQAKTDAGLGTRLRFGGWAHFGKFDDERIADNGALLADPENSTGIPMKRRGNNGIYGVFEQQLYRPPGGDADSGVSIFGLASASPSDRNPINFWLETGIVFANMIPTRPDDKVGAIFEYARYSNGHRGNEYNEAYFSGVPQIIQDFEANLELSYMAQIVPGWTMQPVMTYVWHPNGGLSAANALVIGVRSIMHY